MSPVRPTPPWSLCGVILAAVGYVLAIQPSMLPRTNATQVLTCVLVAMTGYALGAVCGAIARSVAYRISNSSRKRGIGTRTLLIVTVAVLLVAAAFTPAAMNLQQTQRATTGATKASPFWLTVVIVTLVICVALVLFARACRLFARTVSRKCSTKMPGAIATAVGALVVFACFAIVIAIGLGGTYLFFVHKNNSNLSSQPQPTSPLLSGSPQSVIPWPTIGEAGRGFVDGGPTTSQISSVTGQPAVAPIRIFAGLESAPTPQARADLAVKDLQRAGAFDRPTIIVYTSASNGVVDPRASSAAEYITGGNVASVSMQYSVLPSFLSLLLSKRSALEAGTVLLHSVRAAAQEIPASHRPKVFVYGESLGSYGSQAPFKGGGTGAIAAQSDGALWSGTPAATAYWNELNALSTSGPAWQPIVDNGSVVRYAATPSAITQPGASWGSPRAVYLQNATDAVVWWRASLIWSRPGWLDSPRGPDVPSQMRWYPVITFEQMIIDLSVAGAMPPGVGHNYGNTIATGWVAVLQPSTWTPAEQARLEVALN